MLHGVNTLIVICSIGTREGRAKMFTRLNMWCQISKSIDRVL